MKKKIILGKKLFLKKERISELNTSQMHNLIGGDLSGSPAQLCATGGCNTNYCNETSGGAGDGPATFGSLCGNANWRTYDKKGVCGNWGGTLAYDAKCIPSGAGHCGYEFSVGGPASGCFTCDFC